VSRAPTCVVPTDSWMDLQLVRNCVCKTKIDNLIRKSSTPPAPAGPVRREGVAEARERLSGPGMPAHPEALIKFIFVFKDLVF
jgi:hypothetical protein